MASGRVRKWPLVDGNNLKITAARRVMAAFVLGAVLSVGGLAALAASGAAAHGPFVSLSFAPASNSDAPRSATGRPTYSFWPFEARQSQDVISSDDGDVRRHKRHAHIKLISGHAHSLASTAYRLNFGGQQVACVRLCDGFFFPLTTAAYDTASQAAACQSLCPDAPTEVFYRNGSDRIEDAVSARGQAYTSLPVSLRYRSTADNTCSCHRDVANYAPLRDPTLRRGDALMTPAGFLVFHGVEGAQQHKANEFTALKSSGVGAGQRGALQAIERVSVAPEHQSLKDWLVSQATSSAPKAADARPVPERHARADDNKIRLLVWRGGAVE